MPTSRTSRTEWRRIRKAVLTRDGYRCQKCGKRGRLEIDHIRPKWVGGSDDMENLRVLCGGPDSCHATRHKRKRTPMEAEWARYLAQFGGMP